MPSCDRIDWFVWMKIGERSCRQRCIFSGFTRINMDVIDIVILECTSVLISSAKLAVVDVPVFHARLHHRYLIWQYFIKFSVYTELKPHVYVSIHYVNWKMAWNRYLAGVCL